MKILAILFLLVTGGYACAGQNYDAHVVRVVDGDTFLAFIDLGEDVYKRVYVRFFKASAHEKTTPEGVAAKKALTDLLKSGTELRLEVKGRSHGRIVAIVWQGDININQTAIKMGFCRATETNEHE